MALAGCQVTDTTTGANLYDIGTENEDTHGQVAVSNGGTADGGELGVTTTNGTSLPRLTTNPSDGCNATGFIAVSTNCSATGLYIAYGGTSATSAFGPLAIGGQDANAPWGNSVATFGSASGDVAVSGFGAASGGTAAVSGTGPVSSTGSCSFNGAVCTGPTSVSGNGTVIVDGIALH